MVLLHHGRGEHLALFVIVPKGFFPQQDNGTVFGGIQGAQDASFPAMQAAAARIVNLVKRRSGGGQCHRLHRRRWRGQQRLHLPGAQAARRTQDQREPTHQSPAPKTRGRAGRLGLRASGTGFAHRRTAEQRAISVHDSERQPERPREVGADPAAANEKASRLHGREQRPAKQRPSGFAGL